MNTAFDAIVIGAGHAGVESALALARLGHETLLLAISIDSVAYMACNPNVGGTGKGHLVREIDALGGQMALNADRSLLQIKMLNATKGAAVQSLRGQTDKAVYHRNMLDTLRQTPRLTLAEGEATALLIEGGRIKGVYVGDVLYTAAVVVIASGVYLNARIIRGEEEYFEGPSGFARAERLTASLVAAGIPIRRFKTGTPARIARDSIDFDEMEVEKGDEDVYSFSFLTEKRVFEEEPCYLTYTNEETHRIILDNLHRAPMYNGNIKGVGPRYCPSIEDKVVRFPDHKRHQIFVEPETLGGESMYIQGMSSSLPRDVQEAMYRTLPGLRHCRFLKYAYAIEYDCIDPLSLYPTLESKVVKGLFFAGQVNGSSGYEEAAAQGLMAGVNAARTLEGKPPVVLRRDQAYIGVLIDDLVTRGTNEPYRMMTARAEYRITLRQDNADRRLTPLGREIGLVDGVRWAAFQAKQQERAALDEALETILPPSVTKPILLKGGEQEPKSGIRAKDLFKHAKVTWRDVYALSPFEAFSPAVMQEAAIDCKYEGYLQQEATMREEAMALEDKALPADVDYATLDNLRLEARQKLNAVRPLTLGQAARISGISPADINVLIIYLLRQTKQ
ncbi:MAG: tRNA uridine-5-carboxymethylaminomethyl(34) synthesis enzyme MnmG [Clostridia bacterium]|nr:tRNA uridine-5-carboxymethylaminomethyl(34) synthesis enzyme MnmG [Clostridia bacterium]